MITVSVAAEHQKRDDVAGHIFLVCSWSVRRLVGNPFASVTAEDTQFFAFVPCWWISFILAQAFCCGSPEALSRWKAANLPQNLYLSFFLSLSPLLLSTPSLLFDTNWGSQAENELCVEVSLDKREEADGVVIHLLLCRLPLLSLRRWICFRLRVTEMLCDINHITAAWLNWWWICW